MKSLSCDARKSSPPTNLRLQAEQPAEALGAE
jgi:hypothetical protein